MTRWSLPFWKLLLCSLIRIPWEPLMDWTRFEPEGDKVILWRSFKSGFIIITLIRKIQSPGCVKQCQTEGTQKFLPPEYCWLFAKKKRLTSKSTQVSPPCSYHLWKRVGIKCTKSSEIFPSAYFGRNKCDVSVINGRFFAPLEVKWTK